VSAAVFIVVASRPEDMTELGPLLDAHPKIQARIRAYADPYLLADGLSDAPSRERIAAFRAACDRAAAHSGADAWGNVVTAADVHALADAPDRPDPAKVFVDALSDVQIVLVTAGHTSGDPGAGEDARLPDRRFAESLRDAVAAQGGLILDTSAVDADPAGVVNEVCDHVGVTRPQAPEPTSGDAE
jgi:hypothetical protein